MTSDTVCIATDLELKSKAESLRESINCLENNLNEIELERKRRAEQPEFRFLQPVLVRDNYMNPWVQGYFIDKTIPGGIYMILSKEHKDVRRFVQCIPDLEATTRINWIEWKGGECPTDKPVLLKYYGWGIHSAFDPDTQDWSRNGGSSDITAYAIIED
jgi:hypothetical protein